MNNIFKVKHLYNIYHVLYLLSYQTIVSRITHTNQTLCSEKKNDSYLQGAVLFALSNHEKITCVPFLSKQYMESLNFWSFTSERFRIAESRYANTIRRAVIKPVYTCRWNIGRTPSGLARVPTTIDTWPHLTVCYIREVPMVASDSRSFTYC